MSISKQRARSIRLMSLSSQLISSRMRRKLNSYLVAYLFLLPAAALYSIFVLRPIGEVFVLSFHKWDGISPVRKWVGIANFSKLFADPIFWQAFQHNLVWTVMLIFFNVIIGLIAAALLSMNIKGRVIFRLGYFLPVIQASIVTAMIWRWIYNPDGLLNAALKAAGLSWLTRGWLGDFNFALPALGVAAGWASFGLSVVIFLAGMQGVDQTLYDAARVDGANSRQTFLYVTIPALRNVITVVVLLTMIGAFQVFDIIWVMTRGGPIRATEMLATYMYKRGLLENQYGYGSAVAVVLCIIILGFSVIYIALRERGND
ncbi:MAG: sugar ABC transporter permease [Anaerolineae bacterium]|nr:sugar ABC transporter permease [Anaerolineae bacterium]